MEKNGAVVEHNPAQKQEKIPAKYRFLLVLLLFVGSYFLVWFFDLGVYFERERLREIMEAAGWAGFLAFIALFVVGVFLQVPGMIFVAVAMLVYNQTFGIIAALIGSITSVTISFIIVRTVGGKLFTELKQPWVQRLLVKLESRPFSTVIVLRLVFWMAPPLNYALAMTGLKFRDYVLGSFVGLFPPVLGAAFLFEWMMKVVR